MSCCCSCYIVVLLIIAILFIAGWIVKKLTTCVCSSKGRVDEKIIIITGGTAGIGKSTAEEMIRRGAKHVVITGRDVTKGERVLKELQKIDDRCKVEFYPLDLCHMDQVRKFVSFLNQKFDHIDILLNNAGGTIDKKIITSDNLETIMAGNYFGHFLLVDLLIPKLKQSPFTARIINVSSMGYQRSPLDFENLNSEKSFNPFLVYCQSKLAQVYHTRKLTRELSKDKTNITVNCLHPGFVNSEIWRNLPWYLFALSFIVKVFGKTNFDGAQTSIYCCVEPDLDYVSGVYFDSCRPIIEVLYKSEQLEDKLWNVTRKLLKIEQKKE